MVKRSPHKVYVKASIALTTAGTTADQVGMHLGQINELMRRQDELVDRAGGSQKALAAARSNVIASAGSGFRQFTVEEWYSGSSYRLDRQEHAITSLLSFVNINDRRLSEYLSYLADHQLKSANVSKNAQFQFARHELWRAAGLDEPLIGVIMSAFVDYKSIDISLATSPFDFRYLKKLAIDPGRTERIRTFKDPLWRLDVRDTQFEERAAKLFTLSGDYSDPYEPNPLSKIEATLLVSTIGTNAVCLEATLTNRSHKTSFRSLRNNHDSNGVPTSWLTITLDRNGIVTTNTATISWFQTDSAFNETNIFAPVFPKEYTVSDVTSGSGVLIQNSQSELYAKASKFEGKTSRLPRIVLFTCAIGGILLLGTLALRKLM